MKTKLVRGVDCSNAAHVVKQYLWQTEDGQYFLTSHMDATRMIPVIPKKKLSALLGYRHEVMLFRCDAEGFVSDYTDFACERSLVDPPSHASVVRQAGFEPHFPAAQELYDAWLQEKTQ